MTHVHSTVLRSLAAGSAVALAFVALTPASATPQSHALQTTLVSAGDPDGSGTGVSRHSTPHGATSTA